ncbi:MAG: hypothetical protein CVV25_09235 [Ignavibacteriae bacterium HGW-Ignavibacteriae-4]|jgi:hypothetical protein|nr:MAG: hypothetical protein CVV25_09235 [Ignavibacteriae bacterium HGW-Ignavibacteriae-4]
MRKISQILLIAIYLFAISCSDDTNTNPQLQESFNFPLAIGNEWEFDFYWLDESYQATGDSLHTDKSTVINKLTYRGKEAYHLDEDMLFNISYLSVDKEAIYGHVEYSDLSSDGKTYFPDEWINLYSFNQNEWQMYKKNISVNEGDYIAEGTFTMTGKKIGKNTTEINGRVLDVYEYMSILVATGTETIGDQTREINQVDTNYFGIADSIGFYYSKSHDYPTEEEPERHGWMKRVGKYTIK